MAHVTISERNTLKTEDTLTYTADSQHTAGVSLVGLPILGLLVPALNGTPAITVEVCIDGANWYALKQDDGSTAAISITGGAVPFFVGSDELTQLAAYCGRLRDETYNILVRLALSVAQTNDRAFTWLGMG